MGIPQSGADGRDGTMSSLMPISLGATAIFAGTLYVSLATAYDWVGAFRIHGTPGAMYLNNTALFVLTLVWPAMYVKLR